jgi:hypothetical protein
MRKTAAFIEQRKAAVDAEGGAPKRKQPINRLTGKPCHPNSLANLRPAPPFPKGVSGNPGGLPGCDVAALAAREFFARHPTITAATVKELRGLNAYAWSQLADRAFGKVVEKQLIVSSGVSLETLLKARKKAGLAPPQLRAASDDAPAPDTPASDDAVPENPADDV